MIQKEEPRIFEILSDFEIAEKAFVLLVNNLLT
jgi:hypothetical protein